MFPLLCVSLPSRERGLKSCDKFCVAVIPAVAPLAGAWIEIDGKCRRNTAVGSLPSRERGLKCYHIEWSLIQKKVAPLAGAWIEIKIQ